jgi:lysophospholipase L1-like esterase
MASSVAGRFTVEAVSRHPRLGRDYDPVTHTFSERYLNPRGYGIAVDAFPGKLLMTPKGDQQLPPGGDPKSIRDIWELRVPAGTTGFEFSVKGRPASKFQVGPRPPEFTATATKRLITLTGVFHEELDNNAWNWRVDVPGPGTYEVTVRPLTKRGAGSPRTKKLVLRDLLVVSIGDSAASGQGNPDVPGRPEGFDPDIEWWEVFVAPIALYKLAREALEWSINKLKKELTTLTRVGGLTIPMDPRPVWLEPRAYRSLRSGPAHAARLLEDTVEGTVVTFLPFGRTGSEIDAGLLGPRTSGGRSVDSWIDDIGQLEEVVRTVGKRRIDALLIYIGVNDVGVASSLEDLIRGDNALLGGGDDAANRHAVETRALRRLADLPAKFQDLADALEVLNVGQVYLIEYPTGLFDRSDRTDGGGCGVFTSDFDLDLTRADARLVRFLAEQLNDVLAAEAEKPGRDNWYFVTGIDDQFRGHGYCVDRGRFFVQAEESLALQGDTEGTIHPNPDGVKVIAEAIRKSVQKHTVEAPRPGAIGPAGTAKQVAAATPVLTEAAAAPATPAPSSTERRAPGPRPAGTRLDRDLTK